jgi:hypothetical protein
MREGREILPRLRGGANPFLVAARRDTFDGAAERLLGKHAFCSVNGEPFGSFVVSPHPKDLNGMFGVVDLINQAVLNVDPARIRARQITDELFAGRRVPVRVLGNDVEKALRLWPEV